MSCVHPSLAERIRIEAVACSHGRSCREIAGCPGYTSLCRELRQGSAKPGCCARSADCRARKRRKTSAAFKEALVQRLCELPPDLRQTLTPDNGSELSGFRELERADLCAYFCRPHLSGQRSANENEGGLLRQGFPRGISLHKITERMVLDAAEQLNKRPRKCLHYQTPAEVFNHALIGAFAI